MPPSASPLALLMTWKILIVWYMVKVAQGGVKLLILGSERHIKTDVLLLVPKYGTCFCILNSQDTLNLAIKHRQLNTKVVRLIYVEPKFLVLLRELKSAMKWG
jgi:hypothetical protein